jgi:serine/threonine-protein kinase
LSGSGLIRVCRLAEGGMARVDLAIKRVGTFRRLYAIKRLHPHLASDPEFRAMFLDEARIAGLIHHPNVVGVIDVGEDDQGPFLVMDYVDGLPLANLAARARMSKEPMPVQIAVRIGLDVARGLLAAHELRTDGQK